MPGPRKFQSYKAADSRLHFTDKAGTSRHFSRLKFQISWLFRVVGKTTFLEICGQTLQNSIAKSKPAFRCPKHDFQCKEPDGEPSLIL